MHARMCVQTQNLALQTLYQYYKDMDMLSGLKFYRSIMETGFQILSNPRNIITVILISLYCNKFKWMNKDSFVINNPMLNFFL